MSLPAQRPFCQNSSRKCCHRSRTPQELRYFHIEFDFAVGEKLEGTLPITAIIKSKILENE